MTTRAKALAYIAELEAEGVTLEQFRDDFEPVGDTLFDDLVRNKFAYIDGRPSLRLTDSGMWRHAQIQAGKVTE